MSLTIKLLHDRNNAIKTPLDKGAISIRCILNRKIKYFNTGIKVIAKHWDSKSNKVNANNQEWIKLNLIIENQVRKLETYYHNCLEKKIEPTIIGLEKAFGLKNTKKFNDFVDFVNYEMENRTDLKASTLKTQKVRIQYFFDFVKNNIDFNEINHSLILDYERYLCTSTKNGVNSRWTCHKVLKSYLNLAIKRGYYDSNNNPYIHFKAKKEESNRESLTFDELKLFEEYSPTNHSEEITIDKFLFSCYTGLRFSDQNHLVSDNFTLTENECYLTFKMVKVSSTIRNMPLHQLFNGKSVLIAKKYIALNNDPLFPIRTEQNTNRKLKDIAKELGINKNITTHTGRHTFGTLLAEKTNDVVLIKNLMGHKKIETSMIYIKMSNKGIENKLKNIEW